MWSLRTFLSVYGVCRASVILNIGVSFEGVLCEYLWCVVVWTCVCECVWCMVCGCVDM